MRDSLTWWRKLGDPELARELTDLRGDASRFLLILISLGATVWLIVRVPVNGDAATVLDHSVRHWAVYVVAMAGALTVWWLSGRAPQVAPYALLGAATIAVFTAAAVLPAPGALWLLVALVFMAVVLVHPLAGLGFGTVVLALAAATWRQGWLPDVTEAQLVQVASVASLNVVVAWALGRILVRAVESSSRGFAEAWHHAREARANRAELVQALKQLDLAYYRIQRANAALELAWKAADNAERAKSEFVTNISHELRTPLNLIVGFSEMMLTSPETYQTPLPVAYRGDLNAVYRSAQHLLTLTNDVIDLARIGMDHLALVREPVDVADIVHEAGGIVRDYLATKRLYLKLHIKANLPTVQADRVRVRQVLLNLLTNAARFTSTGGVTISARRDGPDVVIAVRDTGDGIPDDQLPRIFEEFYHDGGAHTVAQGGLGAVGLGLPLSRRFIEMHGGRITVESQLGVGTEFSCHLPVDAGSDGGATVSQLPRRDRPATSQRVLVLAGTDPVLADFLQRHLPRYQFLTVSGLAAAGALTAEHGAQAIITHGEPSGGNWSVPVLRLPWSGTGKPDESGGPVARLVKPVTREALREVLAQLPGPVNDILVVDDDRPFVRLITRMLEADAHQPGRTIRAVHDGQAAIASVAAQPPDVILLDLSLPLASGQAVLDALRADERLTTIPVIIISAQDQLLEAFPLAGQIGLYPPDGLRPEELLRLIESLETVLAPPRPGGRPADG